MGLGLAIVKNIIDSLNGSIDFRSVLNEGTIFTSTFTNLKHMRFNHLIVEIQDKIAWISVNRPKKLNALNREVLGGIKHPFCCTE